MNILRKLVFVFFIALISVNLFAQKDQTTNINNPNNANPNFSFRINADAPDLLNQFNSQNNNYQNKPFAVDKAINPDQYIVGPNDLFNLSIYGYINQSLPISVNLEGSLIIPTVGEIVVVGSTMSEAKVKVIKAVKKRYYSSDVSLTLLSPRVFLISVLSNVQKKLEVTPLTRTSDIINQIFFDTLNVSKIKYNKNNVKEFFNSELSLRNIEIVRKDGSSINVDLYKYFSTNDDKYNPYFLEGDIIKIPFGQLSKNYITIEGAVQLAGLYEYNKNDNLESVVNLARGFDVDAELDSISVFRIDKDTKKFVISNLSYENNKDFKIDVYDRVFVKYKSNYIKNMSISIIGEVERPGIYPLSFKNTTLKDAVEMAGGLKNTAYLPLSIVFRRYDEEYAKKDTNEIFINMRANDLIINEKDKLNFERDVLSRRNRMVVDFEKLFNGNDLSQNIMLEDRDVIYINDDKKIVYVYGQVSNEGYVTYKEGANYEYYIERAGGYSLAADEGNTRIIKFNSRGWFKPDEETILSGDFIYVPKKTPAEFSQVFSIVATTIGIVASLITTYLLVKQAK